MEQKETEKYATRYRKETEVELLDITNSFKRCRVYIIFKNSNG